LFLSFFLFQFDPYFHDGLLQLEDPTKIPGTVGLVLKSGYKLHDRCLRAAQVGTVKAPSKPPASE
jgi:molecular chaperone GrpE